MAQLKDSVVSGNLRVTDTTLTDTLQVTTIKAPTSSNGTTYGPGTSGQVLKSNGTSVYWTSDNNANYYHKTGTWNGLTYTAAKVGSPEDLAFTIPTGNTASTVALGNHTHDYLPLSGGKMTGTIQGTYTNTHIALAGGGIGDYATLDHKNNINISSWNGVSISNGCSSVGTLDQVTFSVNARTGTTQQRGNAILYSESGNSPALIFQRGTFLDNVYDWRIYVNGGNLYFEHSITSSSSTQSWVQDMMFLANDKRLKVTAATENTTPCFFVERSDTSASVWFGIGSGGVNHGIFSGSINSWVFVANATEAQTYNIAKNPSTATTYAISFGGETFTTGLKSHYVNDGLRYRTREGVANTEGLSILVLGNGLASSVANNKTGYVRQYSTNEYYTDLKPNTLTASRTILLPDAAGTIAVFPAARTSGQVVVTDGTAGGIKSSGYTIAKSVPSDAKFSDTVTTVTTSGSGNAVTSITASNGALTVTKGSTFSLDGHDNKCTVTNGSTTSTNYGIIFAANPNTTENNTLRKTNDFRYQMKDGAANTEGFASIVLGNTKKLSEANNKSGNIYLYSSGGNWHLINTTSTASNITHTLPAVTGTIPSFTATPTSGQVVVTDGTAGGIKSSGYTIAKSVPSDAKFTDENVKQSETTTATYRPIVFGATNSTDTSTLAATITGQAYVSTLLYAQPQNGILYANRMYLKSPGSKGQLNLLTSKYNVMLRNDDSNTYFLVTAQNDPTGTWTSARPLTINNSTGVCNINGTSSSWATARTLTLGGQLTGSVSVKGDANMTLNGYMDRAFIYDDNDVPSGHTWAEYAWHKFAEVTITGIYEDRVITFLVSRTHGSSAEHTGILSAKFRTNRSVSYDSAQLKWLVRNSGLSKDDFVMVYTSTYSTSTKVELWCRIPDQYHGLVFTVLKEHQRNDSASSDWTLVKTPKGSSTHGSSSYPTTGITGTIISSDGTITNSTTGTATSANALNLTHDNELNFSKLASTGHVWFGYRWNTQGTETSGGTTITKYKFGNANGAQGLAGIEASTSTFKAGTFGDQLIVERTDGVNMAGITFKNTSGVLGYIAANTVDGDLYHYGASNTSTMKYVILDSHNYASYPLPRNIKHIHTASGTEGSAGWVKIARITVTKIYANHPMTFTIAQRDVMQYRIHLVFVNNGSVAAAAISQFIIARDNSWTDTNNNPRAYIIKPSDGIFDLYIKKTEGYDHIFVVDFTKADNSEGNNYSVTWTNVHAADSEITGGTEATKKTYSTTDHTHKYAGSSSAGGAATKVATEVGNSAGARPVFYAYLGDNTRVVYNTNFTYNPSGNVLTAGMLHANIFKAGKPKTTDGAVKGQMKFFSGNASDATGTVTLECVNDAARTGDYTVKLPTWNGTIPVFEKLFDGALSTVSLSYSDIDEYDLFLITVANSNATSEQVTVASLWISNVVGVHDMPLIWGGTPSSSGGACNVTSGWIQLSKNSGTRTFSVAHKSNVAQMTSSGWSISSPTYNLYIRKIFGLKAFKRT